MRELEGSNACIERVPCWLWLFLVCVFIFGNSFFVSVVESVKAVGNPSHRDCSKLFGLDFVGVSSCDFVDRFSRSVTAIQQNHDEQEA
jgi:hypothetical protein